MDISQIEELVGILRSSRISELVVTSGEEEKTTVRLKKPLHPQRMPHLSPVVKETADGQKQAAGTPEEAADYITARMVGIFHSLDSAYSVGSPVKAGQAVGAIESMKLMNDAVSDHDGVIAEILVEDGMPVEFGQNLFKLRKS
jgi:biotin carboxyl carrier protein